MKVVVVALVVLAVVHWVNMRVTLLRRIRGRNLVSFGGGSGWGMVLSVMVEVLGSPETAFDDYPSPVNSVVWAFLWVVFVRNLSVSAADVYNEDDVDSCFVAMKISAKMVFALKLWMILMVVVEMVW
jgi:hypothetical protein